MREPTAGVYLWVLALPQARMPTRMQAEAPMRQLRRHEVGLAFRVAAETKSRREKARNTAKREQE